MCQNLSFHSLHALPALHCCIMPLSSLQLQKKDLSHAEKQRVTELWSQELLQDTDAPM